jgi:hypothetical protein
LRAETSEVWSVLALEETMRLMAEIDEVIPSRPIE